MQKEKQQSYTIEDLNTIAPTPKENLYLCSWNYGQTIKIHTKETLKEEHSDMFETPVESYETMHRIGDVFTTLDGVLDYLKEESLIGVIYQSDNFSIQLIKEGEK